MDKLSADQFLKIVRKLNESFSDTNSKLNRKKLIANVSGTSTSDMGAVAVDVVPILAAVAEDIIATYLVNTFPSLVSDGILVLSSVRLLDFLAYCNVHMMTSKKLRDAVAEFESMFLPSNSSVDKLVSSERKRLEEEAARAKTPKTPSARSGAVSRSNVRPASDATSSSASASASSSSSSRKK